MRLWRWISGAIKPSLRRNGNIPPRRNPGPLPSLIEVTTFADPVPKFVQPGPKRTATPARSVTAFPGAGRGRSSTASASRGTAVAKRVTGFGVMWSRLRARRG